MVNGVPFDEEVLQRLIDMDETERKIKALTTEEIDEMSKEVISFDNVKIHVQHINETRQSRLKMCERTIELRPSSGFIGSRCH